MCCCQPPVKPAPGITDSGYPIGSKSLLRCASP
jgi:hypothetical protein